MSLDWGLLKLYIYVEVGVHYVEDLSSTWLEIPGEMDMPTKSCQNWGLPITQNEWERKKRTWLGAWTWRDLDSKISYRNIKNKIFKFFRDEGKTQEIIQTYLYFIDKNWYAFTIVCFDIMLD